MSMQRTRCVGCESLYVDAWGQCGALLTGKGGPQGSRGVIVASGARAGRGGVQGNGHNICARGNQAVLVPNFLTRL